MPRIDSIPLRGRRTRPALVGALALVAAALVAPQAEAAPVQNQGVGSGGTDAGPALRPGGVRQLLLGGGGNSQDYGPWRARTSAGSYAWVTRIATPSETFPMLIPGVGGTVLVLSIYVPSTQSEELFTLFVPSTPPGVERPMLTAFHGFNVSHLDIYFHTSFLAEADRLGWYLIAPYGVSTVGNPQINFASPQSQLHVEAVIDYVMNTYPVDRDRLYGVGFSMGGGNALSYAARHRDRERGAFAAVVNHTGTVALEDVYAHADMATQWEMEQIFGGSPSEEPFEYLRSSLLDMDASGAVVPGGRHMAQNLVDVPMRTYYGIGDPLQHLVDQSVEFDVYMRSLQGGQAFPHELHGVPAASCGHCWDTIDEAEICDWLATHSLGSPRVAGAYLADRDDLWGAFDVEGEAAAQFTKFDFTADASANRIILHETENLLRVGFELEDLGLDPALPFEVETGSLDGTGDCLVLCGLTVPPASVERDGVLLAPSCGPSTGTPSWCFDLVEKTLVIDETDGSTAVWRVTP